MDKGVHAFSKGIIPKANIIVRLVFKLTYFEPQSSTLPITSRKLLLKISEFYALFSETDSVICIYHLFVRTVGWNCRIHRLHLCREGRPPPPISVLNMTLNQMARLLSRSFEEYGVPFNYHCSQVHSDLEWLYSFVSSLDQIEIFYFLKPFNYVQTKELWL